MSIGRRDTSIPRNSDVLIKISATVVCHADVVLSSRSTDSTLKMKPQVGGHEGAGLVVTLGPDVDRIQWRFGDRSRPLGSLRLQRL